MKSTFNPILELEKQGIFIEENCDASFLLKTAKLAGLMDVDQWTSKEKFQALLDIELLIAFIAVLKDTGDKKTKAVGEIMGGFEEEGRIWIELLVVEPSYRRKGIASALVQKLAQVGRELGYRGLFVDVDSDNYEALKFYKAVKFGKSGSIKEYYYDESDAVILLRHL
ncbi:MAG: GNAT family N-acetyltransferase [Candidatus Odinarchaeota archaeon]